MRGKKVKSKKDNLFKCPDLFTFLMVEEFIYNHSGEYKKKSLWKNLPKKVTYRSYSIIIDYLLYHNKIAVDKEGKIGWIYNPELVRKYLKRKDLKVIK